MTPHAPTPRSGQARGRPGAMLLAAGLSLLLHTGGVLAFVALPWSNGGEREIPVGGMQAMEVTLVTGPLTGGAPGGVEAQEAEQVAEVPAEAAAGMAPPAAAAPSPQPTALAAQDAPEDTAASVQPEAASETPPEPEPHAAPDAELTALTETPATREATLPPPPRRRPSRPPTEAAEPAPAEQPGEEAVAEVDTKAGQDADSAATDTRPPAQTAQTARIGTADMPDEDAGDAAAGAGQGGNAGAAPVAGNPAPEYPARARRRGWEGRTLLEVEVDPHGRAAAVRVVESSGYTILDEAALDAVAGWRFTPAQRAGRAERDTLRVPVRFALE